ncbi:tetratricopeptide repeat protein [Psychroflexus tropicus]|uniref:tetratricopeptide repeat protein n=1 Tax=Psychroflexus tropicus TaxID=197345 RepID=UPI001FDFE3EC|nr:tetratricopeptide repeat protein [Psychroflexus tropicus]
MAQDKNNLSEDVNVDNLGNNTDEFQEVFFKAIAQRAVENPDQAIEELERCLELKPNNTAVFYELAKNHIDLKNYSKAEEFLLKTLENPRYKNNINIHKQVFYVYNMQKRYEDAIEKAEFIAEENPVYFQELANLHLLKDNYKEALVALDRYDAVEGIDEFRDDFRMIIYKEGSMLKTGIKFFKNRFQNSIEDTRAATSLMELYRLDNSPKKAIEIGEILEENQVNDPELYVEMAMAYLVSQNSDKAKIYSKKVVQSLTLEEKDKLKVINTYKAFAMNHPEVQDDFVSVLDSALSSEKSSSSKAELGEFYKSRDKEKALKNFKSALRNKPNDFKLIQNILQLEMELGNYEDAVVTSSKALQSFPAQGYFYVIKGLALIELKQHKEAVSVLEEALDYIFDEDLERNVFLALAKTHQVLGNVEKAAAYDQKLKQKSN